MDFGTYISLIRKTLEHGLSYMKPKPNIHFEVNEYGVDVWVISKGFARIPLHKRDELVWGLLERTIDKEIWTTITGLFILTPKEIGPGLPWEEEPTDKSVG
ncbi:hypothetical protein HYR99_31485 [Candidatus Poribacteria bacterium]|nr:hypothetical protein [Candidatus Poribacteria bacterium]